MSQIDLFPTFCELLGSSAPAWLQGRSLLPAVRDGPEVNEVVFTESTYHVSYQPQRCVRSRRWSYLRDFSDWHRPRLANVDDSASKDLWVGAGWASRPVPAERLHDLVLDPQERVNLVDDPAYADVLADLRAGWRTWMRADRRPAAGTARCRTRRGTRRCRTTPARRLSSPTLRRASAGRRPTSPT